MNSISKQLLTSNEQPHSLLFMGDCTQWLGGSTKKYDLIFADPPFNIGVDYGKGVNDSTTIEEYEQFTQSWIPLCMGNLSNTGSLWIHVPDHLVPIVLVTIKIMNMPREVIELANWCIWHYRFGQHKENGFINSKTHLLHFKWKIYEATWNPNEILVASDRASRYNDERTQYKESNQGKRVPLDVWHGPNLGSVQGNNAERRPTHPNQLPELLLARIILSCSNEGDLVFDPFCGSGTTSTVARALNRKSVTCEINPQFAESAWKRITEVGMIRSIDELQNLYD